MPPGRTFGGCARRGTPSRSRRGTGRGGVRPTLGSRPGRRADVGPTASKLLVERVRERYEDGSSDPAALVAEEIATALGGDTSLHLRSGELSVFMVVGVNGAGKSTTIGKLAGLLGSRGLKV